MTVDGRIFLFFYRIFGDYESLEAGKARDAIVDMMGGVGEGVELEEYRYVYYVYEFYSLFANHQAGHVRESISVLSDTGNKLSHVQLPPRADTGYLQYVLGRLKTVPYSILSVCVA